MKNFFILTLDSELDNLKVSYIIRSSIFILSALFLGSCGNKYFSSDDFRVAVDDLKNTRPDRILTLNMPFNDAYKKLLVSTNCYFLIPNDSTFEIYKLKKYENAEIAVIRHRYFFDPTNPDIILGLILKKLDNKRTELSLYERSPLVADKIIRVAIKDIKCSICAFMEGYCVNHEEGYGTQRCVKCDEDELKDEI